MKVDYIQHCGDDLTVVNAARVSFDKESGWEVDDPEALFKGQDCHLYLNQKDTKLVQYLARHQHTSPFNHSFLTVRVKAPIFVARQLVKHKFMPWNEISRRYVDSEPEFYKPEVWRKRADDKKQGSSESDSGWTPTWSSTQYTSTEHALAEYKDALDSGVCPEQARMVLPQSMYTEWFWSGTLGAFCDMLNLRLKEDTQKETREVATLISEIVKTHWPVSYEALVGDK